jgi:hypothetical protein
MSNTFDFKAKIEKFKIFYNYLTKIEYQFNQSKY